MEQMQKQRQELQKQLTQILPSLPLPLLSFPIEKTKTKTKMISLYETIPIYEKSNDTTQNKDKDIHEKEKEMTRSFSQESLFRTNTSCHVNYDFFDPSQSSPPNTFLINLCNRYERYQQTISLPVSSSPLTVSSLPISHCPVSIPLVISSSSYCSSLPSSSSLSSSSSIFPYLSSTSSSSSPSPSTSQKEM